MSTKTKTAMYWPRKVENCKSVEDEPREITVGMDCTLCVGSDRYPYEVVEIVDARTIKVRPLADAILESKVEGYVDNGRRMYLPDPSKPTEWARLTTHRGFHTWRSAKRRPGTMNGFDTSCPFFFGRAEKYLDPHF